MTKIWFVTGSARGLGREIVLQALRRGDKVAATARQPGQLDDLVAAHADSLIALKLDVTDADAVAAAVQAAIAKFGRLDVVVNNAGYADLASVEDMGMQAFRAQIDTNFYGVVNVAKAVLPLLRKQGSGQIVNVSSVGGRVSTPGLSAYQAAKWAVNGFTEVLAKEVAGFGIKVTAIEPGGMVTDWAGSSMTVPPISPPYEPSIGMLVKIFATMGKPLGDPEKVAGVIGQLADMKQPPVRLLLGSDALAGAGAAAKGQAAIDTAFETLTRSTDRADATATERDPLGEEARNPERIVRRFVDEVINGGNLGAIAELWSEDLVWHGGSMGETRGLAAYRAQMAAATEGSFSGMKLSIQDVVTSGDKVVLRFTNSGTQSGPFMGAPASGRHAEWLGIGIYAVRDGKIAEAWFGEDILGMMLQLGVITLPVASAA